MRGLVVLFDVDGTLLDTGGAGRRSMDAALGELVSQASFRAAFPFSGMTDRAIVRLGLAQGSGRAPEAVPEAEIDAGVARYLARLPEELRRSTVTVCPGVREALAVARSATAAIGLGTGNVRAGAALKLGAAGLDAFAFGGFGCDAEDRAELLERGAARGAERLGLPRGACEVLVVGDTPRDVAAARAIGARALAVATGRFGAAELRASGAALVVETLLEPSALDALAGRP